MLAIRRILQLLPLFVLFTALPQVQAMEEPLMPDQAFKFKATMIDANTVRAEWTVADKYYLYRDKISFTTDTPEIGIGKLELPPGKLKHGIRPDGTEGEVETFSGTISIDVPLVRNNPNLNNFTLLAKSQGCAEIGICYPPHKQNASLELPPMTDPAPKQGNALSKITSLSSSLGLGNGPEILHPDEAFQVNVIAENANTIIARWVIAPKHYMYKDKINVKFNNLSGARVEDVILPAGEKKEDLAFKKIMEVYHDHAEVRVKLVRSKADPIDVDIQLTYQGCAEEAGICYPPQKKSFKLTLPAATNISQAEYIGDSGSELDRFNRILQKGNLFTVIVAALGFGVLLAFTACMYPMIPILSSIIVGQGEKATMARGLSLSLIYVLAMAVTFGVIGGIMGFFGQGVGIQAWFQKPVFLILFALLFVALAMAMFGFYNIQIPAFIQSRLTNISNKQKGGNLIGVALMGVLSALIIGPCGGPILIAALGYAASAGVVNGFLALFSLGLGMGLPLLVVGASGSKLLPRAGDWMNVVKAVAGVILLAVAIVFLERIPHIFPPMLTMLLWAALFIVSGIFMGALEPLTIESTGWKRFWKGIGFTLLLYGGFVMLGGLTGGSYFNNPLHGSSLTSAKMAGTMVMPGGPTSGSKGADPGFKKIKSVADLERELSAAQAEGKIVMLDFYADWCVYCKEYENYVFPDPAVQQRLQKMVLLKADVTVLDDADKGLMKRTNVILPPAIVFFDKSGQEMKKYRIVGSMKAAQFTSHVDRVLAEQQ